MHLYLYDGPSSSLHKPDLTLWILPPDSLFFFDRYRPTDPEPAWTDDGFEMSMGVNHLGHFLLVNLLLDDMSRAKGARVCIVGSITGNTNTVGGGLVYPRADLGNLEGFEKGATKPVAMADGKPFFGAKAYKDSKVSFWNFSALSQMFRSMTRCYVMTELNIYFGGIVLD